MARYYLVETFGSSKTGRASANDQHIDISISSVRAPQESWSVGLLNAGLRVELGGFGVSNIIVVTYICEAMFLRI